MFLPQYKATSCMPIHREANYISVYINFYIFLIIKGKKIFIGKIGDEVKGKTFRDICV
jgi:hypothetical protein